MRFHPHQTQHVLRCLRLFLTLAAVTYPAALLAGPPYRTDDPEPTEYQHYEVFLASQYTRNAEGESGTLPHIEVNYGLVEDVQIGIRLPYAFTQSSGLSRQYGLGDIELGLKYRLLDETDSRPMISFFPSYKSHSGDVKRGLGDGGNGYFLPLWIGKSWGDWTTYGGGGYKINQAEGAINSWSMGWLVQRKITAQLSLGAELFHDTKQALGERATTGFNVGGSYDLNEQQHIILSLGKGIQDADQANQFSSFIAYLLTF